MKDRSDLPSSLVWIQKKEGKLNVNNPTPFYMNLSRVSVGDIPIKLSETLAPFSSLDFTLPKGATGQVKWQVITDAGGESRVYTSSLR